MNGVDLSQQKQSAANIEQLAAAESNPGSALFQSMLNQNKQMGQSQLASTIAQLQAQNRLATSSGQNPLLSQERGSEGVFRNLIQGQEDVGNQALGQTYGQINNAITANKGAYDASNNLANSAYGNTQKQTAAYGTLGDALQGLFGLGGKQSQQPSASTSILQRQQPNQSIMYQQPQNTSNNSGNQLLPTNYGNIANGGY